MPEHFSQKPFLHIALHTFDFRATDAISFDFLELESLKGQRCWKLAYLNLRHSTPITLIIC